MTKPQAAAQLTGWSTIAAGIGVWIWLGDWRYALLGLVLGLGILAVTTPNNPPRKEHPDG